MNEELYQQLGYDLMAAAFEVHKVQGGGMAEEIYQESIEHELRSRGITFAAKARLRCSYKGHPLRHEYVPDVIVGGEIIVEFKAVAKLLPEHLAQLINYLRITGKRVGYLVNFGPMEKLEWKRIVL